MPKILHLDLEDALARLNRTPSLHAKLTLRGAGRNQLILVEAEAPDLERRISPELSKAEMLVWMDAYGRGFARGASDGT